MKKRFIAGAKCPSCGEIDKLVMYKHEGEDFRECVSCGFKDIMRFKPVQREPITRVNHSQQTEKNSVQPLKFPPE